MIEEAYCSYEVSKLLKEKGFDELCIKKYNPDGILCNAGCKIEEWQNSELEENECSAPTQQMAMRYLREVHGLHIEILAAYHFRCFDGYSFEVYNINEGEFVNYASNKGLFNICEEAVEVSVKYVLENLL